MSNNQLKLIIGGDLYVAEGIPTGDIISNNVKNLFEDSDYRLVNLESPICGNTKKNKILKTGPHLRTSKETIQPILKSLSIDAVTLANNHIMDYGSEGLDETILTLNNSDIKYVGAGKNIHTAKEPLTIEKNGLKVAILNFTENEWSIAGINKSGANPLNIISNVNQLKAAKATHDKVICIIHGGHEYYPLPSPRMVNQYHFYAENGADAIINHHTHCISGYEIYNNIPIAYSLGNMLFTIEKNIESWYTGLLAKLSVKKDGPVQIEMYPVRQEKKTFRLDTLNAIDQEKVLKDLDVLSSIISEPKELRMKWSAFLEESKNKIEIFSPFKAVPGRYARGIINRLGGNQIFLKDWYLKSVLNHIRCEAHYDVMVELLSEKFDNR